METYLLWEPPTLFSYPLSEAAYYAMPVFPPPGKQQQLCGGGIRLQSSTGLGQHPASKRAVSPAAFEWKKSTGISDEGSAISYAAWPLRKSENTVLYSCGRIYSSSLKAQSSRTITVTLSICLLNCLSVRWSIHLMWWHEINCWDMGDPEAQLHHKKKLVGGGFNPKWIEYWIYSTEFVNVYFHLYDNIYILSLCTAAA